MAARARCAALGPLGGLEGEQVEERPGVPRATEAALEAGPRAAAAGGHADRLAVPDGHLPRAPPGEADEGGPAGAPSPASCTVAARSRSPRAAAHARPSHHVARPTSSSQSRSARGRTTSTQRESPGTSSTAPPPLRRRTSSTPAASTAPRSTTSSGCVLPSTRAGPVDLEDGHPPPARLGEGVEPVEVGGRAPHLLEAQPLPSPTGALWPALHVWVDLWLLYSQRCTQTLRVGHRPPRAHRQRAVGQQLPRLGHVRGEPAPAGGQVTRQGDPGQGGEGHVDRLAHPGGQHPAHPDGDLRRPGPGEHRQGRLQPPTRAG